MSSSFQSEIAGDETSSSAAAAADYDEEEPQAEDEIVEEEEPWLLAAAGHGGVPTWVVKLGSGAGWCPDADGELMGCDGTLLAGRPTEARGARLEEESAGHGPTYSRTRLAALW